MNIKDVPVVIDFELGRTNKTIKDILTMGKNTFFRLEDSKKDLVSLMIGKQKIGEGKILIRNGKMYVEITKLEE